jgi:hypothetical protein
MLGFSALARAVRRLSPGLEVAAQLLLALDRLEQTQTRASQPMIGNGSPDGS